MLHNNTWTITLGRFLLRTGNGLLELFRYDMTDTKWGHRVMNQVFREGKFSPDHPRKTDSKG
jgi:hypothetical protein